MVSPLPHCLLPAGGGAVPAAPAKLVELLHRRKRGTKTEEEREREREREGGTKIAEVRLLVQEVKAKFPLG